MQNTILLLFMTLLLVLNLMIIINYTIENCRIIEREENSRKRYIEHGGIHPNRWGT